MSAGSGITPIMSMLRSLAHRDELDDAFLIHSARTADEVIFGAELRELAEEHPGFRLHEQHTGSAGRIDAKALVDLCPDWDEREAFISGPGEMLDALTEHWESEGDRDRLHMERFQPVIGKAEETGEGGPIRFRMSDCETECDGEHPYPRGRRGGRAGAGVRLPRGHLPHLHRNAAKGPGSRFANRESLGAGGRHGSHLHQRPRGPS